MNNALTYLIYGLLFIYCNSTAQVAFKFDSIILKCGLLTSDVNKKSNDNLLTINIKSTKNKIVVKYFSYDVSNGNYDKIDSLISINYSKAVILHSQRTPEVYGLSFQYIIKRKNGLSYHDNYILKKIDNKNILFQYSGTLGQYNKDINKYECILQTIEK